MNTAEALHGLRVGLSGAIPSPDVSGEQSQWNARDIMTTVARVAQRVLAAGGRILHGAHPTLLPLIESAALSLRASDVAIEPVELFVVVPFLQDYQRDEFLKHGQHDRDVIVHSFGDRDSDREATLAEMRQVLVASCDVLVCVGGELHATGLRRPGVLVEVELARARGIPVIVAGGAGGESGRITELEAGSDAPPARHGAVRHRNGLHVIDAPPVGTVHIIMQVLSAISDAKRTDAGQP